MVSVALSGGEPLLDVHDGVLLMCSSVSSATNHVSSAGMYMYIYMYLYVFAHVHMYVYGVG